MKTRFPSLGNKYAKNIKNIDTGIRGLLLVLRPSLGSARIRLGSDFWAKSSARLVQFFQKARVEKMAKMSLLGSFQRHHWQNTYSDKYIGNCFL